MAEALLAKRMAKTKLIAETGASQHGVALATAAAYFGMACEIHMGEIDIAKEALNGIEPLGRGTQIGEHSATMTYGSPGMIHGFNCLLLSDENGEPAPVHSIASGLDYPGVGPEHSYFKTSGCVAYHPVSDDEALDAF